MRAFIFPGQGSQAVGMGAVLAGASRAAKASAMIPIVLISHAYGADAPSGASERGSMYMPTPIIPLMASAVVIHPPSMSDLSCVPIACLPPWQSARPGLTARPKS